MNWLRTFSRLDLKEIAVKHLEHVGYLIDVLQYESLHMMGFPPTNGRDESFNNSYFPATVIAWKWRCE